MVFQDLENFWTTLAIFYAIGQILFAGNGQILKHYLAILSDCR